ncbi:formin-like protein 5 [Passer montanus]|uniref:formin-like protein 5 n=1 Tax=Passer montanus TaxID=9160 RepID=UPI00195F8770|nr:formin-like protein 5 [Passer montanus]
MHICESSSLTHSQVYSQAEDSQAQAGTGAASPAGDAALPSRRLPGLPPVPPPRREPLPPPRAADGTGGSADPRPLRPTCPRGDGAKVTRSPGKANLGGHHSLRRGRGGAEPPPAAARRTGCAPPPSPPPPLSPRRLSLHLQAARLRRGGRLRSFPRDRSHCGSALPRRGGSGPAAVPPRAGPALPCPARRP